MYRFFRSKWLVSVLTVVVLSQLVLPLAYGQEDRDLAATKARYRQLKIDVGDGRYASLKEEEIADAVLASTFASSETKAIAQKYRDDVILSTIWLHSSWAAIALYWSAIFPFTIASIPEVASAAPAMVGIGVGISILGGGSIALSQIFTPNFPLTLIQSYNDDVRESLGLTEADVLGQ